MGFEKDVALKIIDKESSLDREATVSLVNEARLGCLLRHPNIVRVDEFDHFEETFYMAMEYVEGWPLDRILSSYRNRGKSMEPGTALQILEKVCAALDYAHNLRSREEKALGIVHRDLKPGNVMISKQGEVKIADFGTAKAATNISRTQEGFTRGTPAYMSPEQVSGKPIDFRSDIFSLGTLIYELFCLDLMFTGSNMVAVMHQILEVDIADAITRLGETESALVPIVLRCMAIDPRDRYSSVAAVGRDLASVAKLYPEGESMSEWAARLAVQLSPISGTPLDSSEEHPERNIDADTLLAPDSSEPDLSSLPSSAIEQLKQAAADKPPDTDQTVRSKNSPDLDPSEDVFRPPDAAPPDVFRPPDPLPPSAPPEEPELSPAPTGNDLSEVQVASPAVRGPASSGLSLRKESRDGVLPDSSSRRSSVVQRPDSPKAQKPVRAWLILVILLTSWAALCFLGPALPGETGDVFGAVRDWQVRLVRGQDVPSVFRMVEQLDGTATIELADVEPAAVVLGAPGEHDAERASTEVYVPGGLFMTQEVTVGQYTAGCPRSWWQVECPRWPGPREGQGFDHPVVEVTWSEAKTWCEAQGWRLPTEAEWELAARGAKARSYPWGENHQKRSANYCDTGCEQGILPITYENDGYAETAPVGSFPAGRSPEGIDDLTGNVSEWVLDCWLPHHEGRSTWQDRAQRDCVQRTVRGGSWKDSWDEQAGWVRTALSAQTRSTEVGFRCVKGPRISPESTP